MIILIIEAFYALVFVRFLAGYWRRRDPVQRDLVLVFTPMTSMFVLEVVRRMQGTAELPVAVDAVAVTLLLAQPYLTVRLVAGIRPVPRWVAWVALAVFVASTVSWYVVAGQEPPVLVMIVVVAFFGVQATAALLFAGEARRRTGAPRARLMLAAAATAVLGLCLLVAGAGGSAGSAAGSVQLVTQLLALLSGLGYVVAFMPPRWLRQTWAGRTALQMHREMMAVSPDDPPSEVWRRYATTVHTAGGVEAAVVLLPDGDQLRAVAISGTGPEDPVTATVADVAEVMRRAQPVTVPKESSSPLFAYARRVGAGAVTAVPLPQPSTEQGVLLLLNRCGPLFVDDDARLLGELGTQAAIIAERSAAATAIRRLNAQLEDRVEERTAQLTTAQAALTDANLRLETQNASLARSNEELQRFAYVASHDLQEPLRKIISFSGLLVERMPGGLDGDTAMYVDRIVGSAARMKRLIEDLLMFSRAGGQVEPRPVDCDRALRAALDTLSLTVAESGATVTHDPLPVVAANRTSVERLFQNLVGNAIKYHSDGSPKIHITADRRDGDWRLTVADNGIGIDMAYADRIFQVFQRLHPRGEYDGTGIGLAVCKRLVESCHGRIGVESTPGAGSAFWFTLPAAPDEPIQEERRAAVHQPA